MKIHLLLFSFQIFITQNNTNQINMCSLQTAHVKCLSDWIQKVWTFTTLFIILSLGKKKSKTSQVWSVFINRLSWTKLVWQECASVLPLTQEGFCFSVFEKNNNNIVIISSWLRNNVQMNRPAVEHSELFHFAVTSPDPWPDIIGPVLALWSPRGGLPKSHPHGDEGQLHFLWKGPTGPD